VVLALVFRFSSFISCSSTHIHIITIFKYNIYVHNIFPCQFFHMEMETFHFPVGVIFHVEPITTINK
jgi:hypothetical protein